MKETDRLIQEDIERILNEFESKYGMTVLEFLARYYNEASTKIGDTIYIAKDADGDSWTGKVAGITDLQREEGGRMITAHGPGTKLALINE